jgi:eukaryotic-like serine/threonine-protein kinase
VQLDPNFARAYAGMAGTYGNLDQAQNAEKYAKLAMQHVDRMTERERYRLRGQYYIRIQNWQKCVEEYSELVKQYPADNSGYSNLAECYGYMLNMPKAMEVAKQGLQLAPKDVMSRMNFTLYSCYASDFKSCEGGAREVFQLNAQYEEAFLALAYAQVGENQLAQAAETYQNLEKVSPWGASLAASGRGELALYEGMTRDAIQILEKGAAADLAAKKPDLAADKFLLLAHANLLHGDKQAAVGAADKALLISQTTKVRFLAARTFVEAGDTVRAEKLADSLSSEIQAVSQVYGKLALGEIALQQHNPKEAIPLFSQARDMLDTWIGRFDLGRAYLDAGAFAEADSEFDRCIKRRGESLEFFMDDMPTYGYFPVVYYYQGRVREGLKSPGFADSYQTYLGIRGQSTEDPIVADIRRRLHQ